MPTYTFACIACDSEFDKNVRYEDIENVVCESCGYRTKRLYNFKGLTWAPTAGGYR
jgi:putative FmdB family regulatory protein